MSKTEILGTWVTPETKKALKEKANKLGLGTAEYIRMLIMQDLEKNLP
jgi:antitoxin component of RelBE/YafQ-DinJ toxin-antitoxin module